MKISRRNRDPNQSRKNINFGVSEMDTNRVENGKNYGLSCFYSSHNMTYRPLNWIILVGDENYDP